MIWILIERSRFKLKLWIILYEIRTVRSKVNQILSLNLDRSIKICTRDIKEPMKFQFKLNWFGFWSDGLDLNSNFEVLYEFRTRYPRRANDGMIISTIYLGVRTTKIRINYYIFTCNNNIFGFVIYRDPFVP